MIPLKSSDKKSIESIFNKSFDSISKKIYEIDKRLQLEQFKNSEIQINKILRIYDELSKNKLSIEEKYIFSQYLLNLFNKANNIIINNLKECVSDKCQYYENILDFFDIEKNKFISTIELLQSSNIHDKVIGIDNFLALSHMAGLWLPELILITTGNTMRYESMTSSKKKYCSYMKLCVTTKEADSLEEQLYDDYQNWVDKMNDFVIDKLNIIRNRKGLSEFEYEDL